MLIDRLIKAKGHSQRLVFEACHGGTFRSRFCKRLSDYERFWETLRHICNKYVAKAHCHFQAIHRFSLEMEDTADIVDALG